MIIISAPVRRSTCAASMPVTGRPHLIGGGLLERVSAIQKPVFVANGDSDPIILPRYSYLLAGLIPGAQLKIYPDAVHGFLFQHHRGVRRRRRRVPRRSMSGGTRRAMRGRYD